MVTTFHDENFNRRDKVEFESAFAELILGIANTQGARANPIFDAVCTVSRAIGADMVAAYGGTPMPDIAFTEPYDPTAVHGTAVLVVEITPPRRV